MDATTSSKNNETHNTTQVPMDNFLKTIDDMEKAFEVIRNFKKQIDNLASMEQNHFKRVEQISKQMDKLHAMIKVLLVASQKNGDSKETQKLIENILFLWKSGN